MRKRMFGHVAALQYQRVLLAAVCLIVTAGFTAPARAHVGSSTGAVRIPSHLTIKDQHVDLSVGGLRAYLESIRASDERLYGQLAADVDRLQARSTAATALLIAGVGIGLASTIYVASSRSDCALPSPSDPRFDAKSAAWDACNNENMRKMSRGALVGLTGFAAAGIAALIVTPKRSELLDVVNKHNRLNPEPLRLHLGYDPTRRFAFASAALTY